MSTITEMFTLACQHLQGGSFAEAERLCRQILQADAANGSANNCLAVALVQQGKLDDAVSSLQAALFLRPDDPEILNNRGAILARLGRTAEAIDSYRQALRLKPDYAQAHYNLGIAYKAEGQREAAMVALREALGHQPEFPQALHDLGDVLAAQGQLLEAESRYRQALRLFPGRAETHHNLGCVVQRQGRLDEALPFYHQAIRLNPKMAEAYFSLGNAFFGQGPSERTISCYRQAIAIKPSYAQAHSNLGQALVAIGRIEEAVASFRRALELESNSAEIYSNLAGALKAHGKFDEVVECYRKALSLKPDLLSALGEMIFQLQHMCQWQQLDELSERLIAAVETGSSSQPAAPFTYLALPKETTAHQQFECARQFAEEHYKPVVYHDYRPATARHSNASTKTHIGYLSADFHEHATAYLIAELIEKHDRDRFAIFGYSYGPDDGSPMRRRIVKAFDRFVEVKASSFLETARRIQADGVDILVDLKGYTQNARPQIMALRPAPIQVSYLGYPGTMAASFIDYILVDDFVVPREQQPFFTEKLVHLPGCYQVNDSQRAIAAHCPSRSDFGLPKEGFVFCCFNSSYKITVRVFEVWMRLLTGVPGSVLWLLQDNDYAPANLRREAQVHGVAPERLVFAPVCALPLHLARLRLANLFLDTFPYNAHTTASDSLWAACPVLTRAGGTFQGRVAGSLLRDLGLPELITTSPEEYETMALRLARNADFLGTLKARLQANNKNARLFDGGQFARSLEQAYATMLRIYANGESPRPFAVTAP